LAIDQSADPWVAILPDGTAVLDGTLAIPVVALGDSFAGQTESNRWETTQSWLVTSRDGGKTFAEPLYVTGLSGRRHNGFAANTSSPWRDTPAASYKPPPSPLVAKVADDVYLVQGLFGAEFSVLFIVFNDYVMVVEALEGRPFTNTSAQVIAKIKETVPGKPIKYLVPTHHHYDHAGGARTYIAEGATIVTTPANRTFFERLAQAPFTMSPDAIALRPRRPLLEIITNRKRVFRDDRHHVELYDVGPYAHADEEIIVYLPRERFLFNGDLYDTSETVAQDDTLHLEQKIRELNLKVEKIAGVHGPVVTMETMRRSIERRRRSERALIDHSTSPRKRTTDNSPALTSRGWD